MTRTDVLRLVGALGWLVVIAMVGAERRMLRRLRSASDPQTAISLEPRGPLARFRLGRLKRAGCVLRGLYAVLRALPPFAWPPGPGHALLRDGLAPIVPRSGIDAPFHEK